MRIQIVAFGRLKTPGLREASDQYLKFLRSFQPSWIVEEKELKPLSVPDKSEATRTTIQKKESQLLLAEVGNRPRSAYYLLEEGGKALRTLEWAELFRSWESDALSEVQLVIGSSLGFGPEARSKARGRLSMGPQTLSHELARVVLFEQIFRGIGVLKNHPYHNEG